MSVDLWHGTGASREQSIRRKGLQTLDGRLCASTDILVAGCFAMARSEFEKQDALLVGLKKTGNWEVDPTMFHSLRRNTDVSPSDIIKIIIIKRGTKLYRQLKEITSMMAIKIAWER